MIDEIDDLRRAVIAAQTALTMAARKNLAYDELRTALEAANAKLARVEALAKKWSERPSEDGGFYGSTLLDILSYESGVQ